MGNGGINGLLKKEILSPPGAPRAPGRERIEKGKVVLASLTHGSLRFTVGSADVTPLKRGSGMWRFGVVTWWRGVVVTCWRF